MTELLAALTSIYVLYVLYEIFKTVSQSDIATSLPAADAPKAEPVTVSPVVPVAAEQPPAKAPAPAVTVSAPAPVRATAHAESAKVVNLRNPVTGEVSPVPGNYRFAKKWIKEAIVTEGLLNKVYKNSELTESVNPKVRAAIEEFKKLEKYHA